MSDELAKVRTWDFPLGADTDTLIICKNDTHRKAVIEAFQMKARYAIWFGSLMGFRAKKIIVFWPSVNELKASPDRYQEFFDINIRCRLTQDGKIIEV